MFVASNAVLTHIFNLNTLEVGNSDNAITLPAWIYFVKKLVEFDFRVDQ